jgi:glycosyltransferase involved in cell wall biosynthesis
MHTIKVLGLSTLFPNAAQPRHGIFLLHRLAHLAEVDGIRLRMVAPVPWFPSANPVFGRYAVYARVPRRSEQRGIEVLHPRYPVLPKLGMTIAPALMAAALLPRLLAMRRGGFDFDVIDSYYLYPDGVAAALLGAWLNRPVLLTAFGTDVSLVPRHAAARAQIKWAVARAAGVTAVCQALKDGLVDAGAAAGKVQVILHGVDQDLFSPPADRMALRRRLGFDRPTLISVGHLIARKGHDLVIAALPDLPGTDLVIAGDGPEEAALRRLAARLGVDGRVRFQGHVEQAQLPALIGAADALVLCSDREGIANVLMEAMACGTPVAASPVWGSPEVVTAPEAGILLRDRSAGAVVEGVRRLLANLPDRAATRRYGERFAWSDTAARHAALIRRAAGAAP